MKCIFSIPIIALFIISFVNSTAAQQTEANEKRKQVMEMLQDSTMRSMVMEHIARDPEMRRQAMQQMRASMMSGRGMMRQGMGGMMQDSMIQTHMQEHVEMMQSMRKDQRMMNSQMMDDPSMRRKMMEWHIKCMESIQDPALRNRNKKYY